MSNVYERNARTDVTPEHKHRPAAEAHASGSTSRESDGRPSNSGKSVPQPNVATGERRVNDVNGRQASAWVDCGTGK